MDYNLDVLVCSHRGAWSANDNNGTSLPENSRASLSRAIELNADLSECDVYITSDGKVVVSHDQNTSRCFNGTYDITSNTLSTLRTVMMPNGETIPTLEDFLTIIKEQAKDGHMTKLRIEIKDQNATDEALKNVFDAGLEDMCEWISFGSAMGAKVKAKYDLAGKTTIIGYLGGDMSDFESYKANGFNMIDCNGLSDANAAAALLSGLSLGAWTYDNVNGMKNKMLQQSYSITTNQTIMLQTLILELKDQK